jgi:hypothetical protein
MLSFPAVGHLFQSSALPFWNRIQLTPRPTSTLLISCSPLVVADRRLSPSRPSKREPFAPSSGDLVGFRVQSKQRR